MEFSMHPYIRIPAVALLFAPSILLATTIHVPADQLTIQEGIAAASAGDTVLVECGTYYEQNVLMKSGVCLKSETGLAGCVDIDTQSAGRGISCIGVGAGTRILGITLSNGFTEDPGGGLHCEGSILSVADCLFRSNWGGYGGAVSCVSDSDLELINCQFIGNSSDVGGAILANGSYVSIQESVFIQNRSAGMGGAIHGQSSAQYTITSCTFSRNEALAYGGAIDLHGMYVTASIQNCTFALNDAPNGSAISMYTFGMMDPNCLMQNSIIAFGQSGEPVYADFTEIEVFCCDVFGNSAGDWVGGLYNWGYQPGNFSSDPLFCNPNNGDYELATDSPCLPENNDCSVLIGSQGLGCDTSTSVPEPDPILHNTTWSGVKALY